MKPLITVEEMQLIKTFIEVNIMFAGKEYLAIDADLIESLLDDLREEVEHLPASYEVRFARLKEKYGRN